jgi:hypothetical protein
VFVMSIWWSTVECLVHHFLPQESTFTIHVRWQIFEKKMLIRKLFWPFLGAQPWQGLLKSIVAWRTWSAAFTFLIRRCRVSFVNVWQRFLNKFFACCFGLQGETALPNIHVLWLVWMPCWGGHVSCECVKPVLCMMNWLKHEK